MRIVEQCGCGGSLEVVIGSAKYAHGLDEEERSIGLELLAMFREQHADHFVPPAEEKYQLPVHWPYKVDPTLVSGTAAPLPDRGQTIS